MRKYRYRHHVSCRKTRRRFIKNGHQKIRYRANKNDAFGYDRADRHSNNKKLVTGSFFDWIWD